MEKVSFPKTLSQNFFFNVPVQVLLNGSRLIGGDELLNNSSHLKYNEPWPSKPWKVLFRGFKLSVSFLNLLNGSQLIVPL